MAAGGRYFCAPCAMASNQRNYLEPFPWELPFVLRPLRIYIRVCVCVCILLSVDCVVRLMRPCFFLFCL